MAREKKAPEESSDGGNWLTTYADLMTLLMSFFVMLFAITGEEGGGAAGGQTYGGSAQVLQTISTSLGGGRTVDKDEMNIAATTLMGSGIINVPSLPKEMEEAADKYTEGQRDLKEAAESFKTYFADLTDESGESNIEIEEGATYIKLKFKEGILFDKGKADLKPEAIDALDTVAAEFKKMPDSNLTIEGHTDSDPISTARYKDNLALSSDRAQEVWRYLVQEQGIDPQLVSATGYGEYRPVAENDTEENKGKNRRVEILITNNTLEE